MRSVIMNVKIVKMISGEEIIGEWDDKTGIIKNPVVMIPVDKNKIAFQPWLPYAEDKEYKFKEEQIHVIANPSATIVNEYNRMFGSGIVVPTDGGGLIA